MSATSNSGRSTDAVLRPLLDESEQRLRDGDIFDTMERFDLSLSELRSRLSTSEWFCDARNAYLAHPLHRLLNHEPVTRRAFEKPRGYSGDAELLDYIYQAAPLPDGLSELGLALHKWGLQTPAQQSVRARRDLLAARIDDVASSTVGYGEILSVACGHLREAQRSLAVQGRQLRRYIGLDQDPLSVAVAKKLFCGSGVEIIRESITRLSLGKLTLGAFDFVYAAGLFDYLDDASASQLTGVLFSMLKPRGRLLIANFAPQLRDIGYMELVMDWRLVYRDRDAMARLCEGVASPAIAERRLFTDVGENIVFLEIQHE